MSRPGNGSFPLIPEEACGAGKDNGLCGFLEFIDLPARPR